MAVRPYGYLVTNILKICADLMFLLVFISILMTNIYLDMLKTSLVITESELSAFDSLENMGIVCLIAFNAIHLLIRIFETFLYFFGKYIFATEVKG